MIVCFLIGLIFGHLFTVCALAFMAAGEDDDE